MKGEQMIRLANPPEAQWSSLVKRPVAPLSDIQSLVQDIFSSIRRYGDEALYDLTARFDGVTLSQLRVPDERVGRAGDHLPTDLRQAIEVARGNIERFHRAQIGQGEEVETMPGVHCWRESRAIEAVGLYIPGGSAPLFSTALMLAVPAQIAGCRRIVLCTPPGPHGKVHPAILYVAGLTGVSDVFTIGGAQAVAAMAMGTATVPRVDKIFGPGNHFVTEAKMFAQGMGVAIDLPAGPSEVLIVADQTADPAFLAADLISQAEHGPDSQVVLLTDQHSLLEQTLWAIEEQLVDLPRADIARKSLAQSLMIQFDDLDRALAFSNAYAPEHLILAVDNPRRFLPHINCAGSVFLGHYTPEALGDYASGTNHTLPTAGWARSYSGVSLDSFVRKITFQQVDEIGLKTIGPYVERMAAEEQLLGHSRAVSVRLSKLR